MFYNLTSSQQNFSVENSIVDNMWNQGVVFVADRKYSYEALNDAFNKFVSAYDVLKLHLTFKDNKRFLESDAFTKKDYPFVSAESREDVVKKAKETVNEKIDCENTLFKCVIFNTPFESGYIICAHHIIIDGFSTQVMGRYLSNVLKNSQYTPENTQSYEEYIQNEESYINSKRYLKDRKFWLQQFSSGPQCSIFKDRKTSLDYESDEVNFRISAELLGKIKALCSSNNISVQSYFNAVYSAYIFRTTGTDFFTIGVPVLNRTTEPELNTVGLYMHIVPLLIKISDSSFLQSAAEIEDAQMNLFRHQKFTQQDIKQLLKEEGMPRDNLFDIAADYQVFEENEDYEFEFVYGNTLSLPLEIHMQSFGEEKHNLKIRYRTSLLGKRDVQTMLNAFVSIIEDSVENPQKKISELNMLTDDEKQKVLFDFNNTSVEYDKDTCVYRLFAAGAQEHPEKTAVIFRNKNLSYAELNELVNSYADKLHHLGIKKGDVVAVHLERSHRLIAFQLAVLKMGAVFLPLDKRFPSERLNFACADCCAALFVTDEDVSLTANTRVVTADEFELIKPESEAATETNKGFCYIIYTSGSTGKPKGCMLTGAGLLNFCKNNNTLRTLDEIENCVFACVNSVSFDYFIAESLLPLTNGFTTVVFDEKESTLQKSFSQAVIRNGINVLMTTPTRLRLFFGDNHNQQALSQLRCICTSGEPLTADLLSKMYEKSPFAKVYNPIGPSECSVWDIGGELDREKGLDIHIGKPIANAQIYIVDSYMNPVPVGVTGEICIGGEGVGDGYLNRPELTAERFIDNPFAEGRLYKTGDLGFWREDGNISFVGRNDFQVKIRGLRIELGEIESAVSLVDGIELAVALVRKDTKGEQYICVFYTGKEKTPSEIKSVIREKLPSYMLPHIYVKVEEMPLTSSGKINRNALPEVSFVKEYDFEEPVNEKEQFVCDAFRKTLSLDKVGRNSDFFDLGGTSLSMITLLSEEGFENITAAEFMKNSTAKELAAVLNKSEKKESGYLETLCESENGKKVFVLFPFGGGGPEGFSSLVNRIKHKHADVSVYFVRFLHSASDCEKAADEIKETLKNTDVFFYSHCAGAAVAMSILQKLEKDEFPVKHYYVGGIIPSAAKDGKNIWNNCPDIVIENAFLKAGAGFKGISKQKKKEIINRFRKDTDFSGEFFFKTEEKLRTPVTVIVGKKDFFTRIYKNPEKHWEKYALNVRDIKVINTKSHYFQTDNAEELTEILTQQ